MGRNGAGSLQGCYLMSGLVWSVWVCNVTFLPGCVSLHSGEIQNILLTKEGMILGNDSGDAWPVCVTVSLLFAVFM